MRPSRAPSITQQDSSATVSGWLSLTPRAWRSRAMSPAIESRSLSLSAGDSRIVAGRYRCVARADLRPAGQIRGARIHRRAIAGCYCFHFTEQPRSGRCSMAGLQPATTDSRASRSQLGVLLFVLVAGVGVGRARPDERVLLVEDEEVRRDLRVERAGDVLALVVQVGHRPRPGRVRTGPCDRRSRPGSAPRRWS